MRSPTEVWCEYRDRLTPHLLEKGVVTVSAVEELPPISAFSEEPANNSISAEVHTFSLHLIQIRNIDVMEVIGFGGEVCEKRPLTSEEYFLLDRCIQRRY